MIFKRFFLFVFLSCLIFFGCEQDIQEEERVPYSKNVVPEGNSVAQNEVKTAEVMHQELYQDEVSPKIDAFPNNLVLQVINSNLDFDRADEQIIVTKDRETSLSNIEIVVIDFNNVDNDYEITWQKETSAVNIRNFNIALEDIVGDHNLEIICFGINAEGNRTLDVFRKTHPPSGIGLFYTSICSISSDGTIEIDHQERSQAYKLGQRNGVSFPIITYSKDIDSDNMLDLIKKEYHWKYQEQAYVIRKEVKVPGEKIEEKQLQKLFVQDEAAYEQYLDGLWYRPPNNETSDPASYEMIHFDRRNNLITFYEKGIQEVYRWNSTHKTRIPNSFYLVTHNELVPFIKKQISLYISSMDSIRIIVHDSDFKKSSFQWDGAYNRLSENFVASLFKVDKEEREGKNPNDLLTGEFVSENGESIMFDFPYFTMNTAQEQLQGGYSIYTIQNTTILELKIIDKTKLVKDTKVYSLNVQEEDDGSIITYSCILVPGSINVNGFKPVEEQILRFDKIVPKDPKEE